MPLSALSSTVRTRRIALAAGHFALVLLIGLLQKTGLFAPVDHLAMRVVAKLRLFPGGGLVTLASHLLDRLGEGGARLLIALAIGLFLARAGRPRAMMWLIVAVGAMTMINPLVKMMFAAPRPDAIAPLALVTSYSFPSGHAAGAASLYGALALLFRNRLLTLVCAAMILATGASRIWLGVHWPSDVTGGWIEGLAWICIMSLFLPDGKKRSNTSRKRVSTDKPSLP